VVKKPTHLTHFDHFLAFSVSPDLSEREVTMPASGDGDSRNHLKTEYATRSSAALSSVSFPQVERTWLPAGRSGIIPKIKKDFRHGPHIRGFAGGTSRHWRFCSHTIIPVNGTE